MPSAARCLRYVKMRKPNATEFPPPKKHVPRRQALDKDLACFDLDTPSDIAFDARSCFLFQDVHADSSKAYAHTNDKSLDLDSNFNKHTAFSRD